MTKLELKRLLKAIDGELRVYIVSEYGFGSCRAYGYRSLEDRGLDRYEIFCKPAGRKGCIKFETNTLKPNHVFIGGHYLSELLMEDINKMIRRKKHDQT